MVVISGPIVIILATVHAGVDCHWISSGLFGSIVCNRQPCMILYISQYVYSSDAFLKVYLHHQNHNTQAILIGLFFVTGVGMLLYLSGVAINILTEARLTSDQANLIFAGSLISALAWVCMHMHNYAWRNQHYILKTDFHA